MLRRRRGVVAAVLAAEVLWTPGMRGAAASGQISGTKHPALKPFSSAPALSAERAPRSHVHDPAARCRRRGPVPVEQHGSGTGGELSQKLERLLSCIVPGMRRQLGWLCVLPVVAALTPSQTASANAPSFASAMEAASQARHVPLPLIEAVAYE